MQGDLFPLVLHSRDLNKLRFILREFADEYDEGDNEVYTQLDIPEGEDYDDYLDKALATMSREDLKAYIDTILRTTEEYKYQTGVELAGSYKDPEKSKWMSAHEKEFEYLGYVQRELIRIKNSIRRPLTTFRPEAGLDYSEGESISTSKFNTPEVLPRRSRDYFPGGSEVQS